ncbi:MAG: aminotransferase class III-fold pyridoxal phosphate-dependent enzyme [Acidobacteria bacterium]|nr:aminotransferase class III-fold pyridoxal phosphate-dependent enzyme [Acidobacteriota bacterium]
MTSSLPALLPTYPPYPFPLLRGAGDRVFDAEGNAYLDFYGGHCVCATGHAHPRVAEAIAAQARELIFYSTAARLPVRDAAAEALLAFAPTAMASAFFCNSGAEANENALKVAAKLTGRHSFVAFRGSFHGRTLLALSATDDPKLHHGYESLLAPVDFLPFGDGEALEQADLGQAAAVIVEPIQSMAGVRTADPAWFRALRKACDDAGALLIFDEVQTGFGRLGTPFAAQYYGVDPDLMSLAKGIASGVPMGALLMNEAVAARLGTGDLGSTFGGGPLASAALLATLEVIREERLAERAARLGQWIRDAVDPSVVTRVHGEGLLLGLRVPGRAKALKTFLQDRRILVGGSHDPEVLRLMPPLTLTDDAVRALLDAIRDFGGKG